MSTRFSTNALTNEDLLWFGRRAQPSFGAFWHASAETKLPTNSSFEQRNEYYAEGERTNPKDISVIAGTAGSLVILTDRLAPEDQPELWEKCYINFRKIADLQKPMMDKLPLHLKGELLSGLAQSAQRTGRLDEANRYLEQLSIHLPGSPYETVASKWRSDPASADRSSLACKTCHDPGRLENRLKALETGTLYAPR
jgi:hypothetical protein